MAGVTPATFFSLLVWFAAIVAQTVFAVKMPPFERIMTFPIVVVPNLWGFWNGIWAVSRRRLPLAWHGALLPFVNFALGGAVAKVLNITVTAEMLRSAPISLAMSIIAYYLVWKYVVAFLNSLVDVD